MGRESDYKQQIENDKKNVKETLIEEKLNQEDITSSDLAKIIGMSDRSVRNMIEKFCKSNEEFSIDDFKEKGAFNFKSNWNGIFTVLMEMTQLPQYDKRQTQWTLEEEMDLNEVLLNGIENYLSDEDKFLIKNQIIYRETTLLNDLYDSLFERIGLMASVLSMMPIHLRMTTLAGFNEVLKNYPQFLTQKSVAFMIGLSQGKKQREELAQGKEVEINFDNSLESYLKKILKMKMQGKDIKDELSPMHSEEEMKEALFKEFVMDNLTPVEIEGLRELIEKARNDIKAVPQFEKTMDKVKGALDPEDHYDMMILRWIEGTMIQLNYAMTEADGNKSLGREIVRESKFGEAIRNLVGD